MSMTEAKNLYFYSSLSLDKEFVSYVFIFNVRHILATPNKTYFITTDETV